jgi:hypothetical protein
LQNETSGMLSQPFEVWLITLAVGVVEDCQHAGRYRLRVSRTIIRAVRAALPWPLASVNFANLRP